MFVSKHFIDCIIKENESLRNTLVRLTEENFALHKALLEIVDKFVHNRTPERFLSIEEDREPAEIQDTDDYGDMYSIAIRDAMRIANEAKQNNNGEY